LIRKKAYPLVLLIMAIFVHLFPNSGASLEQDNKTCVLVGSDYIEPGNLCHTRGEPAKITTLQRKYPQNMNFLMPAECFAAVGNRKRELFFAEGQVREARTLFSALHPIHLGDEALPDWSLLYGNCLEFEIYIILLIQSLTLIVQTYDLETNAPVYLNYRKIAVLPRQATIQNTMEKPNEWSKDQIIVLPTDDVRDGLNRIMITTGLMARPKFSGDLDDFQIRNLRIIAK